MVREIINGVRDQLSQIVVRPLTWLAIYYWTALTSSLRILNCLVTDTVTLD